VEEGVTNEISLNERSEEPGCRFNGDPEDAINFAAGTASEPGPVFGGHAFPGAPGAGS